jgi:hypothetical protein
MERWRSRYSASGITEIPSTNGLYPVRERRRRAERLRCGRRANLTRVERGDRRGPRVVRNPQRQNGTAGVWSRRVTGDDGGHRHHEENDVVVVVVVEDARQPGGIGRAGKHDRREEDVAAQRSGEDQESEAIHPGPLRST